MANSSKARGDGAEQAACDYLQSQKLQILQRNYRCRLGEIDIVARHHDYLVFVEVRLRGNLRFGGAAESVNARKQQRLIHAASHYLASQCQTEPPCRFDVIEATESNGEFQLNWLPNAFQL
ncbi:YraN family protein [Spongiibacter sp.]|uniref:YraN family protein n=1 Tax=Spongiibacter sp. TaxID=2024860 RepID=UPI0035647039